jgi:hypothetical protein
VNQDILTALNAMSAEIADHVTGVAGMDINAAMKMQKKAIQK